MTDGDLPVQSAPQSNGYDGSKRLTLSNYSFAKFTVARETACRFTVSVMLCVARITL